ncbi:MAG: hypothetical protein JRJ27_06855 [Deltaproteobacteria bacterium]|nr:hypothetical protein [Deltaproteobacteria bacterium]
MKKAALITIICLMLLVIITAGTNAAQQTIRVNKVCQSLPGLTMTQVTITDDKTLIDFEWKNTEEDCAISIYAPDNESAFVIKDKRSARTYRLQNVEGIDYYPNKVRIKEGEVKTFTLVFDKMPYQYLRMIGNAAELIVSADYK